MPRYLIVQAAALAAKGVLAVLVIADALRAREAPDFRGRFWLVDAARDAWLRRVD